VVFIAPNGPCRILDPMTGWRIQRQMRSVPYPPPFLTLSGGHDPRLGRLWGWPEYQPPASSRQFRTHLCMTNSSPYFFTIATILFLEFLRPV